MGRILAVIPARQRNEKIPNRNMRIVGGQPLVYYAIRTAKDSTYITDIIVTTDSEDIQIIAEQMDVKCKIRSVKLCEEDVTLDQVVYDAVPESEEWDYVVTLEPICPLLKTETLDAAIRQICEKKIDTMISVKRAYVMKEKSLSSFDGDNKPEQGVYYNAQLGYVEIGAFLISRGEIIKRQKRIGDLIDVYKVSDMEAREVLSLPDLQSIDNIMNSPKVAFYVNGNNQRGLGHIYRTLDLADEFYTKPDIYFHSGITKRDFFGETIHNLIAIESEEELMVCCKKNEYTLFINDILDTSREYMIQLKKANPKAKIINFEDDGEGTQEADLVINALYNESYTRRICVGEQYFIARNYFSFYEPIEIRSQVKRIMISFGGADPQNYTDRLLHIIQRNRYVNLQFIVVLGRAKRNVDELLTQYNSSNIRVMYDVKNMAELMHSCDIAFTSRGRTSYELAMLGVPTVAMSQNEQEERHMFICEENGFTYLGLNPSDADLESTLNECIEWTKEYREKKQKKMLEKDLRNGRRRVMNLIHNL